MHRAGRWWTALLVVLSACEDAAESLEESVADQIRASAHQSRRSARAAASELPPAERRREKLALLATCRRRSSEVIEESWDQFQQAAKRGPNQLDSLTDVTISETILADCARARAQSRQLPPSTPDLDESLDEYIDRSAVYLDALERLATMQRRSANVKSLAPERRALMAAVRSSHEKWNQARKALYDRVHRQQLMADREALTAIEQDAGTNVEYHTRAVLLAAAELARCTNDDRIDAETCRDRVTELVGTHETFETHLEEHPTAADTVFWMHVFRRQAARFRQTAQRFARDLRDGQARPSMLRDLAYEHQLLARHARHLRFEQ